MKNTNDQLPEYLFTWAEQFPFTALTPAQQAEVLHYWTEEDYADMYAAIGKMTQDQAHDKPRQQPARKALLLQHFDAQEKPAGRVATLVQYPVPLWKAAVVVLLFITVGIALYRLQKRDISETVLANVRDTVFVTLASEPTVVRVIDTIYRATADKAATTVHSADHYKRMPRPAVGHHYGSALYASADISILHVRDANERQNAIKGNSIKDDTLISTFRFVTF